jgi:hybrid cluster-associated redox disulfide protein
MIQSAPRHLPVNSFSVVSESYISEDKVPLHFDRYHWRSNHSAILAPEQGAWQTVRRKLWIMATRSAELSADSTIESLLRQRPDAARIILRNGMACVGCPMAPFETLTKVAREYRLDLRSILDELHTKRSWQRRVRPVPGKRRQSQNQLGANGAGP